MNNLTNALVVGTIKGGLVTVLGFGLIVLVM